MDGEVPYIFGNIHIKMLKLKAAMVDFYHAVVGEPINLNNVLKFAMMNLF
jgi:hypothetical protein